MPPQKASFAQLSEILFGHDPTRGVVAAEFVSPNKIVLYAREEDGRTSVVERGFQPYLWVAKDIGSCETLRGGHPYRFLRTCESLAEWTELRAELRRAGIAAFALNEPVQQFLVASGVTFFRDLSLGQIRRMQLDIETCTAEDFQFSNPKRDALAAIALSDTTGWEELILIEPDNPDSERAALEKLTRLIQERDPDILEGHNLFKFDLPFLAARAKRYRTPLAWGRGGSPLQARPSRLQIAEKTFQFTRFNVHGRHFLDTFFLAQFYDVGTRELESFGLKQVARHFGVAEPERVILHGGEIQRAYREDSPDFRTYALQDVRETRALAEVLGASYFIQAQILPYSFQEVVLRGNATKIDSLLLRTYLRERHSVPECPDSRTFEGGYTDIFFTGTARNVAQCDVTSLYPSIMLAFDVFPKTDSLGIFRRLLQDLREFRVAAKAEMTRAVDEPRKLYFKALQNTFKILINSFYGYLGFSQGHFADFDAAAEVTAKGREILRGMVDWLNSKGAKVIEIDTDGVYFVPPEGSDPALLEEELGSTLPKGIEVEFGESWCAMFSYKAKNYALLDHHGRMTVKGGALKSRGLEKFQREFLDGMLRALLEGKPEAIEQLRATFEGSIRSREWPIEMLAKTDSLQDSLASYQRKIEGSSRNRSAAYELALKSGHPYQAGDQISFYITGTKKNVTAYQSAKLVSEWDAAHRDENVEYYVSKLNELMKKFSQFLEPDVQQEGLPGI